MSNESFRFSLRSAFSAILFTAIVMLINSSFDLVAAFVIDVFILFGLVWMGLRSYSESTSSDAARVRHQEFADFIILMPILLIVTLVIFVLNQ